MLVVPRAGWHFRHHQLILSTYQCTVVCSPHFTQIPSVAVASSSFVALEGTNSGVFDRLDFGLLDVGTRTGPTLPILNLRRPRRARCVPPTIGGGNPAANGPGPILKQKFDF